MLPYQHLPVPVLTYLTSSLPLRTKAYMPGLLSRPNFLLVHWMPFFSNRSVSTYSKLCTWASLRNSSYNPSQGSKWQFHLSRYSGQNLSHSWLLLSLVPQVKSVHKYCQYYVQNMFVLLLFLTTPGATIFFCLLYPASTLRFSSLFSTSNQHDFLKTYLRSHTITGQNPLMPSLLTQRKSHSYPSPYRM